MTDYYKNKFGLGSQLIKYGLPPADSLERTPSLTPLLDALNQQNGNGVNEALDRLDPRQANKLYELLWMEQPSKPDVWRWGEFAFRDLNGHSASLETKRESVMKLQEMLRSEV